MANQFYPTSLTANPSNGNQIRAQSLSQNVRDSLNVDNTGTYQELDNIVNEFSAGNTVYNSSAKYPTDVKNGTEDISDRTQTVVDLESALSDLTTIRGVFSTRYSNLDLAVEKAIASGLAGNSFFNLQSKIEKINRELNRLNDDLLKVTAGTAVNSSAGRYPSSQNRFTNTAGGR